MATKTATLRGTDELVRQHVDYFNKRKLEDGSKQTTTDFEWEMIPFGEIYRGAKGYVECNRNWTDAFPDAKMDNLRVAATTDNVAVIEFRGKGIHKGTLQGPDGPIKATNKKVDFQVCEVYEFKNDKLRRVRTYFDTATLLHQLGLDS